MIESQCRVCGKCQSRFLSKVQIQGGSLGSLFGKVTVPVTKEVAKKLLPALGMAAVMGQSLVQHIKQQLSKKYL